ncbi:MAG TPA: HD domain-containing phosphohydrolase [Oxalicibacterium sp.]|jgi:PAS domain S-box-containing protein|nr:HD domain-containing phosphohydrolase [Oxalicibacterium sp.]
MQTSNPSPTDEIASMTPAVSEFFEGSPVPTFAIDCNHVVTHWNHACELISGLRAQDMVGTRNHWKLLYAQERPLLVDLIVSGTIEREIDTLYRGKLRRSTSVRGTYRIDDFFPHLGESGRWLSFSAAPLCNSAGELVGAIEVLQDITLQKNAELALQETNGKLEQTVQQRTAELRATNEHLTEANQKLKSGFLTTIKIFSNLIEMRAGHLAGHSRRVADLARRIAGRMDLDFNTTQEVFIAALLHNIGKIGFSDELLATPMNMMNSDTLATYRKFTLRGEQLLMPLEDMGSIARIIRSHQERWDGGGFPDQLKGVEIPIGARILAIASDYENLQNGTLLQKHLTEEDAFHMTLRGVNKRYDPAVLAAFQEVITGVNPNTETQTELCLMAGDLKPGMVIARDLIAKDNFLLLSADHVLSQRLIDKIMAFERTAGIRMTVWVRTPKP